MHLFFCNVDVIISYVLVYSWRDYYGEVPHDAILTGLDKNQKPMYLGQVLYENKIIPGKIVEGDKNIKIEYFNREYTLSENVKVIYKTLSLIPSVHKHLDFQILCSHQPEKLDWIKTNNTEVRNLALKRTLIRGGFEPNCVTYLGRLPLVDHVTNVGKVVCCKGTDSCYGLYTTDNGAGQLHIAFEILAYVEDKPNTVVRVGTSKSKDEKEKSLHIDVLFN